MTLAWRGAGAAGVAGHPLPGGVAPDGPGRCAGLRCWRCWRRWPCWACCCWAFAGPAVRPAGLGHPGAGAGLARRHGGGRPHAAPAGQPGRSGRGRRPRRAGRAAPPAASWSASPGGWRGAGAHRGAAGGRCRPAAGAAAAADLHVSWLVPPRPALIVLVDRAARRIRLFPGRPGRRRRLATRLGGAAPPRCCGCASAVFPPGDARHWPDIVAAPRLDRTASASVTVPSFSWFVANVNMVIQPSDNRLVAHAHAG